MTVTQPNRTTFFPIDSEVVAEAFVKFLSKHDMNRSRAAWQQDAWRGWTYHPHSYSRPVKVISCGRVGLRAPFSNVRLQSTIPSGNPGSKSPLSRFDRFVARTPTRFLRTRLSALKSAPLTHITSFLLLHEITAVVPLFALAGAFHYYQWLPPFFAEGEWVLKGVTLFGNYFRRKGWISSSDAASAKSAAEEGRTEEVESRQRLSRTAGKWWNRGEGGTRLVIEFATAYAIVKALLPLRIVISVWGAPWFARYSVIPMQNAFKRMFRQKNAAKTVGTNGKAG